MKTGVGANPAGEHMVKKSQQIKERIDWLAGLYDDILERVKDPKIAQIIYRRVVFEE